MTAAGVLDYEHMLTLHRIALGEVDAHFSRDLAERIAEKAAESAASVLVAVVKQETRLLLEERGLWQEGGAL
jgi:hypothetical protein